MPQSMSNILIHLIFSTKNRYPFLQENYCHELYQYITGILNHLNCITLAINGTQDHIHILLQLQRTISIAKVAETTKSNSSRWIKIKWEELSGFSWQPGYGSFSVDISNCAKVVSYIQNQKKHHHINTFVDEFRLFLNRYNVKYDGKFLE